MTADTKVGTQEILMERIRRVLQAHQWNKGRHVCSCDVKHVDDPDHQERLVAELFVDVGEMVELSSGDAAVGEVRDHPLLCIRPIEYPEVAALRSKEGRCPNCGQEVVWFGNPEHDDGDGGYVCKYVDRTYADGLLLRQHERE